MPASMTPESTFGDGGDQVRALLFGVAPRGGDPVDTENPLLAALERTPMDLVDLPDPGFLLPDWVVTRPLLTGICGSDAKQVFMDWGEGGADNPMREFSSMPQVLGHEVVAEVVALGPEAEGVDVGDRVVLNPWLSCVPRGVSPVCPACEVGDLSLCWNFQTPPIAPGIHTGTSKDASGGWAHAHAGAPVDAVPRSRRHRRRGRGVRRPVRGVAPRRHAPRADAGRQGARVRRGCARLVRGRDPARAVPRRRGGRRGALRRAGRAGAEARRAPGLRARARRGG